MDSKAATYERESSRGFRDEMPMIRAWERHGGPVTRLLFFLKLLICFLAEYSSIAVWLHLVLDMKIDWKGPSNTVLWKCWVNMFEEHDIWDLVEKVVMEPFNTTLLDHNKMAKVKWVILDLVKDDLVPHIVEKTMGKDMFDALVTLYQSENINQDMLSKNKLWATWMTKIDIIAVYLMKIMEFCY